MSMPVEKYKGRDRLEVEKNSISKNGFSMPKGYFDEFENSLRSKLDLPVKPSKETIIKPIKIQTIIAYIAIAASIVWVGFFMFIPEQNSYSPDEFIVLNETESLEYIEVGEYMLAENMTMSELDEIYFEENYISEDNIYEYIVEEDFSEFIIMENL